MPHPDLAGAALVPAAGPDAYLAEGAANSDVAEVVASTAAGARTVEAFRMEERRIRASREALETSRRTRMRTLFLRSVFFPVVELSYIVPVAGCCCAADGCTRGAR